MCLSRHRCPLMNHQALLRVRKAQQWIRTRCDFIYTCISLFKTLQSSARFNITVTTVVTQLLIYLLSVKSQAVPLATKSSQAHEDPQQCRIISRAQTLILPSQRATKCPYPRKKHNLYKAWQANRIKALEESVGQLLSIIHRPNVKAVKAQKKVTASTAEIFKDGRCTRFYAVHRIDNVRNDMFYSIQQ